MGTPPISRSATPLGRSPMSTIKKPFGRPPMPAKQRTPKKNSFLELYVEKRNRSGSVPTPRESLLNPITSGAKKSASPGLFEDKQFRRRSKDMTRKLSELRKRNAKIRAELASLNRQEAIVPPKDGEIIEL